MTAARTLAFVDVKARVKAGLLAGVIGAAALSLGCDRAPTDTVAGDLVLLNDNGAYCWYQDERIAVDPRSGTLFVGSVASTPERGRGGDIDVAAWQIDTGRVQRFRLDHLPQDDHNAPALWFRSDGRLLAMYTTHNRDKVSRYRITDRAGDVTAWGAVHKFDWGAEVGSDFNTTYSNLVYLSAEGRLYDFARAVGRSPNFLVSDDEGETFTYGGRITHTADVGYVNGYFKYASNGVDRIHFIGTEHHPRDYDTSIYHGYLEAGVLHRADGQIADPDAFDPIAGEPTAFTKVFAADTEIDGVPLSHAWPSDLEVDAAGRPYAVFTARVAGTTDDHRFVYARFDGSAWHAHRIGRAGKRLFRKESDYTGLAALHPRDPNTLYLSTRIDPRDGSSTPHHEIYRAVTADGGASWRFTAITSGSSVDNLRPIVPRWDSPRTALVWLRGKMKTSQSYQLSVVGLIDRGAP